MNDTNDIYDAYYYNHCCGPVPYSDKSIKDFFVTIAEHIVSDFHPETVLDAGCATGHLVAALRDLGVEAYGVDISEYAISQVREDVRQYCAIGSLTEALPASLPAHYDLVVTIEVLEHLYARQADLAIRNLCTLSDRILFSSSPDDVTEKTHHCVQQREYWSKRFAQNGFLVNLQYQPNYITNYALAYYKSANWVQQIEAYERMVRGCKEIIAERDSLMTASSTICDFEERNIIMNDSCTPSRLGIFVFYDKDGIVDDYVPYLLRDLKKNLTDLVIVVNGKLTAEGRDVFASITDQIFVRENVGFDFGAWKYAITMQLGWEKVRSYDELVLVNSSFFGPFYPFKTVFDTMATRNVDFWGITAHGDRKTNDTVNWPNGIIQHHIQNYIIVFRKVILCSRAFKQFWLSLPQMHTFLDAIRYGETALTVYFEQHHFSWDVYIDCSDLDAAASPYANGAYCMLAPAFLLKRGLPVLKSKCFCVDRELCLALHLNEEVRDCLSFIRAHTSYDERMIFQHILRQYNITDIHNAACLNYVLPNQCSPCALPATHPKTLVIIHLYYMDLLEEETQYFHAIPAFADVLVTTTSTQNEAIIERILRPILGDRLRVCVMMQNRGREMAALLVLARPMIQEYEYLCFCKDKKSQRVEAPTGFSYAKHCWENMLSSEAYVNNILQTFADEPCLGLLVQPPYDGGAFRPVRNVFLYWGSCFESTYQLARRIGLNVPMSQEKLVLTIGTTFWARVDALLPLLSYPFTYEDFPPEPMPFDGTINHAIERIFAFVAQDMGYYTGWVMTPETAAVLVNNSYPSTRSSMAVSPEPIGVRIALKIYVKKHMPPWLYKMIWRVLDIGKK